MIGEAYQLLEYTDAGRKKIRLLGISISHFGNEDESEADDQLLLEF
jgi:hypothetical protein